MLHINRFAPSLLGAALAAAALISPVIVSAQEVPSYAVDAGGQDQQIQGTVSAINGTWNITVSDANGYADSVELHQGTIINPTGLTLEPGMQVTIDGYADGPNFDALEIDTPYQYAGPAPVAVYYGPGSWYPGYAEGWGPSFSLFFDFSSHRWEQRAFSFDGRIRTAQAPPAGWQNRPHGYVGSTGSSWSTQRAAAPVTTVRRNVAPVARNEAPVRPYSPPEQQTRSYAPPQQQARTYSAPPQQTRSYAPPQQQARTYSAPPQQTRSYSPPQQMARTYSAPPQQTRSYSPPQQQARASAPAARAEAPAGRGSQNNNDRRH